LRATALTTLLALALACNGGGPASPDDDGIVPAGDLAIVWDGRTVDWGADEILRAEIDGQPVAVEWRSLSDHYLGQTVVLGRGPEVTTAALRPGTNNVEARIDSGGTVTKRDTVEVTVEYRQSWKVELQGMIPYADGTVGDVWVVDENAFVARRHAGGISIVDLAAMREIGRFTADGLFTQDVKAAGDIVYVSNETNEYPFAVTFLDVSDPTSPRVVGGVPTAAVGVAHNLWIDGPLLALASQVTGAIHLYDVSDLTAPVSLSTLKSNGTAHDIHMRNGLLFGSYMRVSLLLASIVQPANPVVLAQTAYPDAVLTHSSWLAADGRTLYVADEVVNAPIRIFDVSDPAAPALLGTYQPRLGTIPHNFQVRDGRFAYLAHYKHGVEVLDVSDPVRPRLVGFYDTHPGMVDDGESAATGSLSPSHEKEGQRFDGAWGVHWTDDGRIVVSDMSRGLFVFRYTGD
jgi:choice-of-anchor B domain-containing protein